MALTNDGRNGKIRNIREMLLLGLIAAGLLLAVWFISMSNVEDVSAIKWQWTGLDYPMDVAIGDYDNDGLNDLAFTERDAGNVTVYKSDGITVIKQWTGLSSPFAVAIGDYDNNGLNDLAFTEFAPDRVTVYKSDGTTVIKQWTGLNEPLGVAIGDYDNDGLDDLAFSEANAKIVTVYKRDGTTVIKQWTGFNYPIGVAIGDYDNNGLSDLALADMLANKVSVYYQTIPGTHRPTIVTLRGTLTNATGYPIQSGSVNVTIYDSLGIMVWHNAFNDVIDDGKYNIPLGTKKPLKLVKGQIYSAILEVDADSPTYVSADVVFGDNNPAGDIIKFVAD